MILQRSLTNTSNDSMMASCYHALKGDSIELTISTRRKTGPSESSCQTLNPEAILSHMTVSRRINQVCQMVKKLMEAGFKHRVSP